MNENSDAYWGTLSFLEARKFALQEIKTEGTHDE